MKLKSSPRIYKGYKCDYPENTVKRITEGFGKMGFRLNYVKIKKYRRVNRAEKELFFAGRVEARKKHFIISQFGKGVSATLARASAYAELAERFSANIFNSQALYYQPPVQNKIFDDFFGHYTNLKGYKYGHQKNFNLSVEDLIAHRMNLSAGEIKKIKQADVARHWVPAYSLLKNEYKNIPVGLISKIQISTGLAAGNMIEEAILHGVYEIFERFAAQEIIVNKKSTPTIDVKTIKNKRILEYIDFFKSANYKVLIKDFSLNNLLPCVGVFFVNKDLEKIDNAFIKSIEAYKLFIGSDLNLDNALVRCFTEAFQLINIYPANLRNKKEIILGKDLMNNYLSELAIKPHKRRYNFSLFLRGALILKEHVDWLEKKGGVISWKQLKNVHLKDCLEEIRRIKEICKTQKWDLLVVDHTHPVLKFPVVRVIAPGISDMLRFFKKGITANTIINSSPFTVSLYNIENLNYYLKSNNWLKNRQTIKRFIKDMEEYLSSYNRPLGTEMTVFCKNINLFAVVAFAYLAIGDIKKSRQYFRVLRNLSWSNKEALMQYHGICRILESEEGVNIKREKIKELLGNYKKSVQIQKYFLKEPFTNPFVDLCNYCNKCSRCIEKRMDELKEIIKTFR